MKTIIKKIGINGEGIGYVDRIPVFIPGALLDEEVEFSIVARNKRYMMGKLERIIKKSKDRMHARCGLYQRCGSCVLMEAKYEAQLQYKKEILKQSLIKYAHVDPKLIEDVRGSENILGYRNSCKMPSLSENRRLMNGFYKPNSNYLIPVKNCEIHEAGLEKMRNQILHILNRYEYPSYSHKTKIGLRNLILRGFEGHYQCTLVCGKEELNDDLIDALMKIKGLDSLWYSSLTTKKTNEVFGKELKHLAGSKRLSFHLKDLTLEISPRSFFQLNTKQAIQLYECIASLIKGHQKLIVEAYSGIGGISLFLKDKADEIIGIESIHDAVVNANMNARNNGANHVHFICDDAAHKLEYISKKQEIDTLVIDPPRSGIDEAMISCILKSNIKQVIYVSCNPATLGKDLHELRKQYIVKKVIPFDLFPHTQHVESVVLLTKVHN